MIENTSDVLKALAHPVRIQILKQLYDGPICVCHINENIDYSQANISKHLKIFKKCSYSKINKRRNVSILQP